MKQIHAVLLFLFCSIYGQAQVGINNPLPDSNSVLDLKANNKGLLIPRMTTVQREAMVSLSPTQGMMVYDTKLDVIFIFYSSKWYAMNPWKTEYRTDKNSSSASMTSMTAGSINYGNIGIGVPYPTEKLQVNGKIKATEFIGYGAVPLGGIIMWSGKTPPTGYVLCVGGGGAHTNHFTVPDLRGRFVVGFDPAKANYNQPGNLSTQGGSSKIAGGSGGLDSVSLDLSQIPRHNHGIDDPSHTHKYYDFNAYTSVGFEADCSCDRSDGVSGGSWTYRTGQSVTTGITVEYGGGVGSAQSGSNGANHENRPPYYTLAYIMRVF